MRPIDAHALWVAISNYCNCRDDALLIIDKAPTIETKPIKHGHWVETTTPLLAAFGDCRYECSNCKNYIDHKPEYMQYKSSNRNRYCDCCGAKMDGDEV